MTSSELRESTSNACLALVGGTIYVTPTEEPIRDGVVLVRDGKIAAVGPRISVDLPPDTQVLDCSRRIIAAGFWNSHVHFFERKWADAANIPAGELGRQLEDMLTRYGFTSVFDIGSMWENTRQLRERIERGEVLGPRIRSTGEALLPPNALPAEPVLDLMGAMKFPAPEIANASQAAAASRRLLEGGVDGVKLFASSPRSAPLPQSAMEAAVGEAHRAGKPVFVHPNSAADIVTAVRAGVDIIAHTTPRSGPWAETVLATMTEARVALTPTLTIWKFFLRHDRLSTQEHVVGTAVEQLRSWAARGGTVLFGTDLGAIDYDPSEEYRLMADAGMSFSQILASLTTAPAERFGDSQRAGRIAPGLAADLAVLRSEWPNNVRALTAVECTLRDGKIIYRGPSLEVS